MRKDVECTFGILKGRWRILMTDDRVYGIDKVDEIWLTCCALHRLAVGHRWNIQPMEGRCSCQRLGWCIETDGLRWAT